MRYTHALDATGRPEWLRVVHAVNGIRPDTFGEPIKSGDWWAGGQFEDYPEARIVFRPDGESVDVIARSDEVDAALRLAHREVTGTEWPR